MEKITFENGTVDTKDKPFSICWMVFSPNDDCNLIYGETEKVKSYWESIEESIDFDWYLFETKEEMEAGIAQLTKTTAPISTWRVYKVADCKNGSCPDWKLAVGT